MSDYEAWAAAWAKIPSHVAAANEVDRLRAALAEAVERAERAEEDCERIQMWLDDKGIPRANERDEVYSIVRRIMHLLERAEAELAAKMAELKKNKELDERLLQVALECRVEANVRAERAEAELAAAHELHR